jgi:Zn-dependent protease
MIMNILNLLQRVFAPSIPIFGVPFTVIWPLVLLFMWRWSDKGMDVVWVLFASMILHEVGHAVAARLLGERLVGAGFGGYFAYVRPARGPDEINPLVNIAISLAGPAVNLGLGWVLGWFGYSDYSKWNTSLGIGNLMPFPPLDGHRALASLLALTPLTYGAGSFILTIILFLWLLLKGFFS